MRIEQSVLSLDPTADKKNMSLKVSSNEKEGGQEADEYHGNCRMIRLIPSQPHSVCIFCTSTFVRGRGGGCEPERRLEWK